MAVAHKILVAAYEILKSGETYRELGGDYLDKLHLERRRTGLVKALKSLGYDVMLTASAATVPVVVDGATSSLEGMLVTE